MRCRPVVLAIVVFALMPALAQARTRTETAYHGGVSARLTYPVQKGFQTGDRA